MSMSSHILVYIHMIYQNILIMVHSITLSHWVALADDLRVHHHNLDSKRPKKNIGNERQRPLTVCAIRLCSLKLITNWLFKENNGKCWKIEMNYGINTYIDIDIYSNINDAYQLKHFFPLVAGNYFNFDYVQCKRMVHPFFLLVSP